MKKKWLNDKKQLTCLNVGTSIKKNSNSISANTTTEYNINKYL